MKNILPKLIITTLAGSISLLIPLPALAASSLSLSPSTNIWPSDTFSVGVTESSGATTSINSVKSVLNYPTAKLECRGVNITGSVFNIPEIHNALTSCGSGTITIVEGATGNGISGDNKLVANITFKVRAGDGPDSALVSFVLASSAVVKSPGNTNDLSSASNRTYTICKIADLNCVDPVVDYRDAALFIGAYGTSNAGADMWPEVNPDGTVDYHDAAIFLREYGT
jgi:hypothetical protein